MESLGPLIGENFGVERARIDVREDGLTAFDISYEGKSAFSRSEFAWAA